MLGKPFTGLIAARYGEQRKEEAAGGALLFGFFLLGKQEKEARQSGETDK